MTTLQSLVSDNNTLEKLIPTTIGRLSVLKELVLGKHTRNAPNRVTLLSSLIFNFYSIELNICIDLIFTDNNLLSGPIPTELGNLRRIEYLSFCKYCDIIMPIMILKLLIWIQISNTDEIFQINITSFTAVNKMSGSIPSELGNLVTLKNLDIRELDLTMVTILLFALSK